MDLGLAGGLGRFLRWDLAWCLRMNRASRIPAVRGFFRVVSRLGDGVFWYASMLALLLDGGSEAAGPVLHMALTGLACTLVYKWLKGRTLRPRPYQVYREIDAAGPVLDPFSFPSGHTLHAVAFTVVALAWWPGLAPLFVPFTLLVALSRPILGLHYPSDVLAGAAIGAAVAALSMMLT